MFSKKVCKLQGAHGHWLDQKTTRKSTVYFYEHIKGFSFPEVYDDWTQDSVI